MVLSLQSTSRTLSYACKLQAKKIPSALEIEGSDESNRELTIFFHIISVRRNMLRRTNWLGTYWKPLCHQTELPKTIHQIDARLSNGLKLKERGRIYKRK